MTKSVPQVDTWIWGTETIIWGYDPTHKYTFKMLAPKKGREGCLSLQYHHEKSESWFQLRGMSWALVISDGIIVTRILRPGDVLNLPTGTIHRLMGLTDDCQVLEPSTPDRHAADKSVAKDVVRLHCVLGRPVDAARDEAEAKLIADAILITDEACAAVERGELPSEINAARLLGRIAFSL